MSSSTAAATKPNLAKMPGAAHEREASADSRAKAFKNKGKDNEVRGALPEFARCATIRPFAGTATAAQ